MSLSDTQIKALKPREKPYKVSDEKGLYLEVTPSGGKLWRLKYRFAGKEKKLALGGYPDVSLAQARKRRDEAKALVAQGDDPGMVKQRDKAAAQIAATNTFASVAEEFIATKVIGEGKAERTIAKERWLLSLLTPSIGRLPISDIKPADLLVPLKKLERKGNLESAQRCRNFASRVFRYGCATARCENDPAITLVGAITSPKTTHYAAILDPKALGELLRVLETYDGHFSTRMALQIAPHVFVRPGELRGARWEEFDLDEKVWMIPAERMKMRRSHAVPLTAPVLRMLESVAEVTGRKGLLFPSVRSSLRAISDNTLNAAFRRMGYTPAQLTAHGLRSTASTLLNESGKWHPDAIERALAHGDNSQTRGAYHRAEYWDERKRMYEWWSDYLDTLRKGGEVIPLNKMRA